jgi:Spy/CpxP family protein refolding chaperone
MARHLAWLLAAALLGTPVLANDRQSDAQRDRESRSSTRQDQNRWKWWINPEHRRELGITDDQSKQIDAIFESSFPAQRAKYREAEKLDEELSRMLKESVADVATVTAKVEQLEKLQAERRAMRTVMLYRINLVLSPEQRVKLENFWKKREENRRRQPDHRH